MAAPPGPEDFLTAGVQQQSCRMLQRAFQALEHNTSHWMQPTEAGTSSCFGQRDHDLEMDLCSAEQGQDPREQLEPCQGRFRLDIKERFFPHKVLGTAQAP